MFWKRIWPWVMGMSRIVTSYISILILTFSRTLWMAHLAMLTENHQSEVYWNQTKLCWIVNISNNRTFIIFSILINPMASSNEFSTKAYLQLNVYDERHDLKRWRKSSINQWLTINLNTSIQIIGMCAYCSFTKKMNIKQNQSVTFDRKKRHFCDKMSTQIQYTSIDCRARTEMSNRCS